MRLYVIDDDRAVARTVARNAAAAGFEAQLYDSAAAFLEALDALEHGCVVLDIKMAGMSGLELLDIMAERRPELPVIMLTGHAEVGAAVQSFRTGAIHFLAKPYKTQELIDALSEAVDVGARRLRAAALKEQGAALEKLSPREREVLAALGEGKQSKAIAWQLGISVRTVDLYRSHILAKLSARNTSQAVALAKACGFPPDGDDGAAAA